MTAPRPPFRRAFPFWALLLWLAVGLSVWPAQALTAPAPAPLPAAPIGEQAAKRILGEAGLPIVDERLSPTAREAVSAAIELGFPVALKIASPDILHKTEAGGVELGLAAADDVAQAFAAVIGRARLARPDARIEGVLVSRMVTGGVETILGGAVNIHSGWKI